MADLTGRNADETKPDIATWGSGNVLETGEGTTKVDLDDKASIEYVDDKASLSSLVVVSNEAPANLKGVSDYKCDGDGDDEQINQALQDAKTRGIGCVTLMGGGFNIKNPIRVPSNVRFFGYLEKTPLNQDFGTDLDYIVSNENINVGVDSMDDGVIISGIKVVGEGIDEPTERGDGNNKGIVLRNAKRSHIYNSIATNVESHGIWICASTDCTVEKSFAYHCGDDGFESTDGGAGLGDDASISRQIKFINCRAEHINDAAFECDDGPKYVSFINCSFDATCTQGIQIHFHENRVPPENILISNLNIDGCQRNAVNISSGRESIYGDGTIKNITISSSIIKNTGSAAIRGEGAENITLSGVEIINCDRGPRFFFCKNVDMDVSSYENTKDGTQIADCDNVNIKGTYNYNGSAGNSSRGLFLQRSNNVLISSLFDNNRNQGMYVQDSDNINIDSVCSNNEQEGIDLLDTNNVTIRGKVFNSGNRGIEIDGGENIHVHVNSYSNNGEGIRINSNPKKITVKGDYYDNQGDGIYILQSPEDVTVDAKTYDNVGAGASFQQVIYGSIKLHSVNNGQFGLLLRECHRLNVGGIFYNNSLNRTSTVFEIHIRELAVVSSKITVQNAKVIPDEGRSEVGIRLRNGEDCVVINNDVRGVWQTSAIEDFGTGTITDPVNQDKTNDYNLT